MTKIEEAQEYLLKQCGTKYRPTMGEVKNKFDLSIEDMRELVRQSSWLKVRMCVEHEQPLINHNPTPTMDYVYENLSITDLRRIQANRIMAMLQMIIGELADHVNAAGTNGVQTSVPQELRLYDVDEWPEFLATCEVKKTSHNFKFDIRGEWEHNLSEEKKDGV